MQHKPTQMNPNWCVIVFDGELNNIRKVSTIMPAHWWDLGLLLYYSPLGKNENEQCWEAQGSSLD